MAATLIGTTGKWGIDNPETGLIVASYDLDYQNKKKETLNNVGEIQGLSYYGETVGCSLKGEVPTTSPFSGKLTGTLSLANAIPAHTQATLTSARNIIEGVKFGASREDFQTYDVNSMVYPLIAAS